MGQKHKGIDYYIRFLLINFPTMPKYLSILTHRDMYIRHIRNIYEWDYDRAKASALFLDAREWTWNMLLYDFEARFFLDTYKLNTSPERRMGRGLKVSLRFYISKTRVLVKTKVLPKHYVMFIFPIEKRLTKCPPIFTP